MSTEASERLLLLINGYCRNEANDMIIVDGIIRIIFEYHKLVATWSKRFKGQAIELSEDDTKATYNGGEGYSVRAEFGINRGEVVSWEFKSYQTEMHCYFYGVVSSKELVQDFGGYPAAGYFESAWGVDDGPNAIYLGQAADSKNGNHVEIPWNKPIFPRRKVFTLRVVADWKEEQCKLSFFYRGEKLNDTNDEYTFLLPVLDDEYVWYPCVSLINNGAYCIIHE